MCEMITIPKYKYNFYKACVYHSDFKDPFTAATSTAYGDLKRTLNFKSVSAGTSTYLRNMASALITAFIYDLAHEGNLTQDVFDEWHRELCRKIIKIYNSKLIDFTYGQAQKWINMTFKHLHMMGVDIVYDTIKYCHVPMDNYILDYTAEEFGIKKADALSPYSSWSSLDDYEKYLDYQKTIRKKVVTECPLIWESKIWHELL